MTRLSLLALGAFVVLAVVLIVSGPRTRIVVGALFGGPLAYVATGFLLRDLDPAQPRFFSFPFSYMYPEYNLPCWMLAGGLVAWLLGKMRPPRSKSGRG